MRFYPFGSGSISTTVVSASSANYATTAISIDVVLSASRAVSGSTGPQGPYGACLYVSGSSGSQGPSGPQGPVGTVDGPFS
jgi:hypothetical protein